MRTRNTKASSYEIVFKAKVLKFIHLLNLREILHSYKTYKMLKKVRADFKYGC